MPRQGPGPALRAVREREPRRPAQRRRPSPLPELLAPRPAQLEALREVRQPASRRRGHRGRAGLPELPPGTRPRLQHLRDGRQEQDRDLPGNRHPGLQPVPQPVGRLLPLRDRSAGEGRHAGEAALRPLPQPRPRLLEAVPLMPGDMAALGSGMHPLPRGPEAEKTPRLARRHHPAGTGPAAGGPRPRRPAGPHAGLAAQAPRPARPEVDHVEAGHDARGTRRAAARRHPRPCSGR